jgi:serine/threonine-protein kinase
LYGDFRHYQQVIDGLGRSLSLVTAPNSAHIGWLKVEARFLAHRSHPSIPSTYHYWAANSDVKRGPGYLRRWITGETVRKRVNRMGETEIPFVLQVLRGACSTLAYLHDSGRAHGGVGPDTVWLTPGGRLWLLEWQWAIPHEEIPAGLVPSWLRARDAENESPAGRQLIGPGIPIAPEWASGEPWRPTRASDQWQVAAMCFTALAGEPPPSTDVPPIGLVRLECPARLAAALDRALQPDPAARYPNIVAFLRDADASYSSRSLLFVSSEMESVKSLTPEDRLRISLGDEFEVLSRLGAGAFGTVWRARDLSLEREVAVKVLHPHIARDARAVTQFLREARLAAQLAHPAIVPIYDWESRGGLSWYVMELAEEGSLCNLVENSGPRTIEEIAPQIELLLDGLGAAHSVGIIHRDIKPENVLIDRYHRWRLTDFGIANITGEAKSIGGGTPAFAAPEQLLKEAHGPGTDLFSLAAVVAFALTGAPPFGDGEPTAILARQLSKSFDEPSIPASINAWLRSAFPPEPEKRFSDAAEMKAEWDAAVEAAKAGETRHGFLTKLFHRGS